VLELARDFDEARLLAARGELGRASALLDSILERQADHQGALLLKASLLLESRRDEAALELCDRAVRASPRSVEALDARARCLHALGRDEEALAVAESARRLLGEADNYKHGGPVYLTLVWCLRELGRRREAVAVAEEGLARWPDAVLAQWASLVEEELAEAEKERC
jgi:tetratricopeptide (TPR) repeat protein